MNLRKLHFLELYLSQLSHINCWLLITSWYLNLILHNLHSRFLLVKRTSGYENLLSVEVVLQTATRFCLATIILVVIDFVNILVDLILLRLLLVDAWGTHVIQIDNDLPTLLDIAKCTVFLIFMIC